MKRLIDRELSGRPDRRIFDLGCGNGTIAARLHDSGYDVTAIDVSESGIAIARQNCPAVRYELGSAYDDLASVYGTFPLVISLEVVEHLYSPRDFARTLCALVASGGLAIVSTPYHGYLKNLALALTGKLDAHFTALWDNGHIKFWSRETLGQLLREAGFENLEFARIGRIAPLAKTMVVAARRRGSAQLAPKND